MMNESDKPTTGEKEQKEAAERITRATRDLQKLAIAKAAGGARLKPNEIAALKALPPEEQAALSRRARQVIGFVGVAANRPVRSRP